MTPSAPSSHNAWVLYVHAHLQSAGTLIFAFEGGVACEVEVTPAQTSLLLALAACRAIDLRDGQTVKVGYRGLSDLGQLVGVMPGPGNPITAAAIGDNKRAIARKIRKALEKLSREVGEPLHAPMPILHGGYAQGYCLADGGLPVLGVPLDELVRAARSVRIR